MFILLFFNIIVSELFYFSYSIPPWPPCPPLPPDPGCPGVPGEPNTTKF